MDNIIIPTENIKFEDIASIEEEQIKCFRLKNDRILEVNKCDVEGDYDILVSLKNDLETEICYWSYNNTEELEMCWNELVKEIYSY